MRLRTIAAAFVLSAATVSLSGCALLAGPIVDEVSQNGPVNDRPVVAGPAGWEEFPSCEAGPRDDFVWVDGFPYKELEAAGIAPQCGDTWIEQDGDHFINVTSSVLVLKNIDELGTALESSGWEKKWDDFDTAPTAPPGSVGARDYYIDNDERKLAIEIYNNGTDPFTYTAFIDYSSPETRELTR